VLAEKFDLDLDLDLDRGKDNLNGGAMARGHPRGGKAGLFGHRGGAWSALFSEGVGVGIPLVDGPLPKVCVRRSAGRFIRGPRHFAMAPRRAFALGSNLSRANGE
jgi:hypothetical protein